LAQILFGSVWPLSFAAILRAKIGDLRLHRKIALEGHRFPPQEALEAGLVDELVSGDTQAVLEKAIEVAELKAPLAKTGVFGLVKVCFLHCL
jgi:enoyl-CoA hydratase/carnithine racemase